MSEYEQMLEMQLRFAEEEKQQAIAMAYEQGRVDGRVDGIAKCIEEVIPTLYEFDVEQEVIDFVQKWMEKLKEQK